MTDTDYDRCIKCHRWRMGLAGEYGISGWLCKWCVMIMDGHNSYVPRHMMAAYLRGPNG